MVVVSHLFFFYDKNALCNFGKHEGYIAITTPDSKYPLKSILTFIREVVETDEKLKCDKYCHLGVMLVNKREFGDDRYGYGMICENP